MDSDDDDRRIANIIRRSVADSYLDDDDDDDDGIPSHSTADDYDDDRILIDTLRNSTAAATDDETLSHSSASEDRLLDDFLGHYKTAADDNDRLDANIDGSSRSNSYLDDDDEILLHSTAEDDDNNRILIDTLRNSTAVATDDESLSHSSASEDRLLDDFLGHYKTAADDNDRVDANIDGSSRSNSYLDDDDEIPLHSTAEDYGDDRILIDSLGNTTAAAADDDSLSHSSASEDRLLDDILGHYKASNDDNDNIMGGSKSASPSFSSFAYTPAQFFSLNYPQQPQLQTPRPTLPPLPNRSPAPKVNWLCLPREVLATILLKLGAVEIIESAQKVCTLWRSVSLEPSLWTCIDMRTNGDLNRLPYGLSLMCRDAVNRSRGGCVDISIEYFGDDYLLDYIINCCCRLRRLRLVHCLEVSNEGLSRAAMKLPLLETFENYYSYLSERALVAIGQNCPHLATLRYEQDGFRPYNPEKDDEAFAISKYMPGLRHLSLVCNTITNTGLGAILDSCPHLESLELRQCFNVDLKVDDLVKKCERIKDLKWVDGYNYLDDSSDYSDYDLSDDYEDYSDDHYNIYDF